MFFTISLATFRAAASSTVKTTALFFEMGTLSSVL